MTSDREGAADSRRLEFKRLEVKYLVDRSKRSALLRDLRARMRPDEHAGPDGTYLVRSLYFDSPHFMAYHEKLAGTAVRHKLRARIYGAPEQAPAIRLEVKSRYLSFIHKLAFDVPRSEYPELMEAIAARRLPHAFLAGHGGAQEFFRLQRQYAMEPRVLVQYRRLAFERRELCRTRVNFDFDLRASRDLGLFGSMEGARPLLRCGRSVFEIKVDGVLPFWLHMLISKYDLQNEAVSKYCYAVRSEARLSALARADALDTSPETAFAWQRAEARLGLAEG